MGIFYRCRNPALTPNPPTITAIPAISI